MAHSRGVCYPSFHYLPFLLYLLLPLNCRGKTAPSAITPQKTSLSFHKVLNLTSEPLALLSTVCCAQTGTILVLRDSQAPLCECVGVKERERERYSHTVKYIYSAQFITSHFKGPHIRTHSSDIKARC